MFNRLAAWAVRGAVNVAVAYQAASTTLTRLRSWIPGNQTADTLIVADGEIMRARARELERENGWAKGAVDLDVANVIGTGITPRSAHPDETTRQKIDAAWKKDSKYLDADGTSDFYGMQKLVCRRVRVDGEIFVRVRLRRPEDPVLIQFQMLEADHVPYSKNEVLSSLSIANRSIRAGIEFDAIGRRTAYWMFRDHPGSMWKTDASMATPIPADQVLHVYEVDRPGQVRGASWLIPAMVMLRDIKQLVDAALMRNKVTNLLSVWITRGTGTPSKFFGEEKKLAKDGTDKGDSESTPLMPGSVNYMNPGESATFMEPKESGIQFREFLHAMLGYCGRALNMTFEQFTGVLSDTNFSSIKVGILEYRRIREAFQYLTMVHQFCLPAWDAWVTQQVIAGRFGSATEYRDFPERYEAIWDPPGWPWINVEDVEAAKAAVRAGLSSRSKQIASTGESPEAMDQENARDNERADKFKLVFDSDGRYPDGKGKPEPKPAPAGASK